MLFLHVFLAFPTGRLSGASSGCSSAPATSGVGPQLVGMVLGGFGPDNLLALGRAAGGLGAAEGVSSSCLSAFCPAGIVVLVVAPARAGRPRRRSLALLIDSFALGLVMIAVLCCSGASGW